ncbi:FKBP-type peptidyl-prolyl cis-trans isomerase [Flavobacteriaceae bacterium F08102]|nr:FKBP-type peptidyl-prolyl cis-trans isomerase [Flavobacteriaceae bacterium F08102]
MRLKILVAFLTLSITLVSCNKDDDGGNDEVFDAAEQAVLDDETLVSYLETHFYVPADAGEDFGKIDTIVNGETPLMSQVNTENIVLNDISYKLYYLKIEEGVGDNPTRYDSIHVKYRGFTLDSLRFDENTSYSSATSWFNLGGSIIQGWKFGFPHFKEGVNSTIPGEPISYENTGKGILFIPSGLAYGNFGAALIAPNKPLLFFIELGQVITADNDNDLVPNKYEDIDGDGELFDDDSDGDGTADYLDNDDDGDGILTRNEDIDGDGDPRNDDTNNNGIPNYLDPLDTNS